VLLAHHTLMKLISNKLWQRRVVASIDEVSTRLEDAFIRLQSGKKSKMPGTDVIRSSLRVVDAIQTNCKEALSTNQFAQLLDRVLSIDKTREMLEEIKSSGAQ